MKKWIVLCLCLSMLTMCISCGGADNNESGYDPTKNFVEGIEWPDSALAKRLPTPEFAYGEINHEQEDSFSIDFGNVTKDQYDEYVKKCKEAGYTVDYNKSNTVYWAYDSEGYYVYLSYDEEFSVMGISTRTPDEDETNTTATETTTSTQKTENTSNETGTKGYFKYTVLGKNSVEITKYTGDEETVTIPSEIDGKDVTHIGKGAFENCTTIEEFIIWATIEYIGDNAFKGCTSLEEISISSKNEYIGKSAFEGCTSLEDVIIWGGEAIEECAFKGCTSLDDISIPSDIEVIGKSAFEGCTDLKDLTIWGTETIEESAFRGCTKLKELSIPSDTKKIGDYAFHSCTNLKEVTIWGDDTELGKDVFGNCPDVEVDYY